MRHRSHPCINLFFFLITAQCAVAQDNRQDNGDSLFAKYAVASDHSFLATRPYYVIQWPTTLRKNIRIARQLDEKVAIIEVTTREDLESLRHEAKIAEALDSWKFSPSAERRLSANHQQQQFIISSSNIDVLLSFLRTVQGDAQIISVDRQSNSVVIQTSANFAMKHLLPMKEVTFIDVREEPHDEAKIIGYDRSFDGINAVDYAIPGANGNNIVAGVKEQKMQEEDLDIYKRVLPSSIAAANVTDHATVISSIIGGSGNRFYDGRGIANACRFFPSTFSNLFADDSTILNANHVTVQNHSYGTVIQQFYGAEAVSYDEQAWANKKIIHVFSAGNEGTSAATGGQYANIPGFANLTGNFKMAKNVITVGAIDNNENIPLLSSAGPLYDGRLAPQLIALGPNGTSDAAAIVTGTIAVMQQVYADSNNQSLPPASLVKALLYNTADDVYSDGIDYKTGFGLLNSYAAIRSLQKKEYDSGTVTQDRSWTKTISVPAGAAQLKVTLAWIDTPASANNNRALINDLDMQVTSLADGSVYKPWVLNSTPNADSLSQPPTRRRDSLNTAEQVSIDLPVAGNYNIKIIGTSVQSASMPFHIAFHMDTLNTFAFTSPQNTSDIRSEEQPGIFVRWKTFVADSNETGNLYISYDKEKSWQLIQSSLKIYRNEYLWTVKDTTSTGVFKMETSFGSFLSKQFIISPVTRLSVDFVCED
ncbi:MAG TPA: S8 family serine peptidase, partial [Parafilimonas sp.]|nr:S8 family serine peptidase [Parafilimonas sp.]